MLHRLKISGILLLLVILFRNPILVVHAEVTEEISSTETDVDSQIPDGWVGDSYYRDGKAVNGWQEIDGYTYYFKKHILQRNTIAGTKAAGRYYVGPDGIRVNTAAMNRAVKFVLKNSKTSDSRKKRLKDCCKALMKYYYFHMSSTPPKASEISGCAEYMLKYHKGNCYRFASAMSYVAVALGYRARVAAGGVTSYSSKSYLVPHGWCEIRSNDTWMIWDLSMQRIHAASSLIDIRHSKYPFQLRRIYIYKTTIAKGKITWKRIRSSWSNTTIKDIR